MIGALSSLSRSGAVTTGGEGRGLATFGLGGATINFSISTTRLTPSTLWAVCKAV